MILKILFTLIVMSFNSVLFSSEFYLNPYYTKQLSRGTRGYSILHNYIQFINRISLLKQNQQIIQVNNYFNAIVPKYDADNYNNEEYWATPFEFLTKIGGDCEDYVIIKRYTLNLLGISNKNMYYNVVKEKYTGGDHMVLTLKINNIYLTLDNLSTKVLAFNKRVDLESVFLFNEKFFYKFNKENKLVKINNIYIPAFDKMLKRNKQKLVLIR